MNFSELLSVLQSVTCSSNVAPKATETGLSRLLPLNSGTFYQMNQGARKDGRGNEPVGSCAMCDARSTGPRALEGKNR